MIVKFCLSKLRCLYNEVIPSPLGMTGSFYVDSHQDGSKTILWHVRVLDFDMTTGTKNEVIDTVTYTIGM